jgi:hypothetical protein
MSFELAWPQRSHRVRFKRPIRVVPLIEGPPRAYRVLSGNLSKQGMFLSMPEPFQAGTRVALSLEAGGRVLPFAQAEVVWRNLVDTKHPVGGPGTSGFGVRFTNFLHPRAHELVQYLVDNLDTGRPLALPKQKRWRRVAKWTAGAAASVLLATLGVFLARELSSDASPEVEPPAHAVAVAEPVAAPIAEAAAAPAPAAAEPESEPSAVPAAEATPAATVAEAARPSDESSSTGLMPLPKCGASSLRWSQRGGRLELEVAPVGGAKVSAAFRLKNPERLVVDLVGVAPKRSFNTKSEIPGVSMLRIGKRKGGGTRLVLDLQHPSQLKVDGARLTLSN